MTVFITQNEARRWLRLGPTRLEELRNWLADHCADVLEQINSSVWMPKELIEIHEGMEHSLVKLDAFRAGTAIVLPVMNNPC